MSSIVKETAVASGSHLITVSPKTESQEVQFNVSESNPKFDGSLITATLKRPSDNSVLTNIGFCYTIGSTSDVCVHPTIFPSIDEWRIYVNGTIVQEACGINEIQSTYKELLLTEHGETSTKRTNAFHNETGSGILGFNGCFACTELGPSATPPSRMVHTFINRMSGSSFKELPMKNINEFRIEFKLSPDSLAWSNSSTAAADVQITNFEVWGTLRSYSNGMKVPSPPYGSTTLARERYDRYTYTPSNHPFQSPDQTFQVQLSTIFPQRDPIIRVLVYGEDPADPDKYRCRVPFVEGPIDLIEDGNSNNCGTESSGITGGKRGNLNHRESSSNVYYENKGVEIPTNSSFSGHNKAWSFDGLQTTKSATHAVPKPEGVSLPVLNIDGIHNKGNLQLEIKNGAGVLPATANMIVEIVYLEMRRITNGSVSRVTK